MTNALLLWDSKSDCPKSTSHVKAHWNEMSLQRIDTWFMIFGTRFCDSYFEWKRLVLFPIIFCIGKEITIFSPHCGLFFRHIHWISDMRLCINTEKIVDYGFYPTAHYSISLCLCRLHQHAHLWSFLKANKWIKWKKNKNQN